MDYSDKSLLRYFARSNMVPTPFINTDDFSTKSTMRAAAIKHVEQEYKDMYATMTFHCFS